MAISTPPAAPNPLGTNFAAEALAFTQWMQTAAPEFNTAVGDANQAVTDAEQAVVDAATQVGLATTQAGLAATQAGYASGHATAADNARGAAVTAKTQAEDARDMSQTYAALAGAAAGLPALAGQALKNLRVKSDETGVEWAGALPPGIERAAKTSAYTLVGADKGALIDCSGTWTLAIDAAATLGNGWWCYVRNSGTGDITLDPNSTETIDGIASFVLYPGAVRLLLCDGAALHSIPLVGGTKTYTTTGSYVWAPGVQQWDADLIGGGAGGGGGARAATRYDGGGGGAGERWKTSIALAEVTVGASVTCTVGAKGTGGAAASVDNSHANKTIGAGTSGGASSIGTLRSVAGGTHSSNGGANFSHGDGPRGGGKGIAYTGTSPGIYPAPGQLYTTPGDTVATEWAGPAGRAGSDSGATGIQALLGGQRGGRSGAAVAAGTAGANGVNPGDGGDGGAGNINGSPAGKGGDGVDGKITIAEVI